MKKILLTIISVLITLISGAQNGKNLAELLGYPKDSKLLIIHADDLGLSKSTNDAVIKAFDARGITSGSIMMPCPQAEEIAAYAKNHPGLDIGIHLTMTAEWDNYKWGGITPREQISSLLDKNGNFYASVEELAITGKGIDAEKELRAQVDKAIRLGVVPTHIDTHMGSVMANGELMQVYLKLSDIYNLPILFPRAYLSMLPPDAAKKYSNSIFLLDNLYMLEPQMIGAEWIDAYKKGISELKPGLNQIIVHLAIDNEETRAICKGHPDYGSEWRQKDLDLVLGNELKDNLRAANIILITWKQIRDLMNEPLSK